MDNLHGHYNQHGLLHKLNQRQSIQPVFLETATQKQTKELIKSSQPTPRVSAVVQKKALAYPSAKVARDQQRRPSITSAPDLSTADSPQDTIDAPPPLIR